MTSTADTFILSSVAGTSYAVRTDDVRHMEMLEHVTPVPNARPWLEGVVFSRGEIVPVLNLRARFGFERATHDLRTRVVVVRSGDRSVGLLVDSAREFVRIPPEAIQPPSLAMAELSANYLDGVASIDDRLVLVLNVTSVLDLAALPADRIPGAESGTHSAAGG
jgi:purine-binding chemotaxis protein CheW